MAPRRSSSARASSALVLLGEHLGVPEIAGIDLGEDGEVPHRDEAETHEPRVVPLPFRMPSGRETSGLVLDEEVGGVEEEEPGIDALPHEGAEDVLLDPVDHRPGEETAAALVLLTAAVEPLEVASEGSGGGTADGGNQEGHCGGGEPAGHLLAAQRPLDPGGELEEEDLLDGVPIEEARGDPSTEGLEKPGLGGGMEQGRHLAELEGAKRSTGGGELSEERVGGADVDDLDVARPLLRPLLLDEVEVPIPVDDAELEVPGHPEDDQGSGYIAGGVEQRSRQRRNDAKLSNDR